MKKKLLATILLVFSITILYGQYRDTTIKAEDEQSEIAAESNSAKDITKAERNDVTKDTLVTTDTKDTEDSVTSIDNENDTVTKIVKETKEFKEPEVTKEIEKAPDVKISGDIYEIKGTSSTLSKATQRSLLNWRTNIRIKARENPNLLFLSGIKKAPLVALTFDDGPDTKVTPLIIDILNQYGVKGNFFFTGQNVKAYPKIVKKAYDDGHLILGHSYNHPKYTDKSEDFIKEDFEKTEASIAKVIGKTPLLVRPPYGIVTENVLKVAEEKDVKLIIWSTDTLDWSDRNKDSIAKNVLDNIRPGEIVLMHSLGSNSATAEALPMIIEELHKKGYKITTLDEILGVNAYKE